MREKILKNYYAFRNNKGNDFCFLQFLIKLIFCGGKLFIGTLVTNTMLTMHELYRGCCVCVRICTLHRNRTGTSIYTDLAQKQTLYNLWCWMLKGWMSLDSASWLEPHYNIQNLHGNKLWMTCDVECRKVEYIWTLQADCETNETGIMHGQCTGCHNLSIYRPCTETNVVWLVMLNA